MITGPDLDRLDSDYRSDREMEPFNELTRTIAIALGAGWASGLNLYAAILVLGLLGVTGNMVLPENLGLLTNPLVIGAAAVMDLVEFFADKIPTVDSGWDAVHTFIRIPAGAMLAAGAVGEVNPAIAVAAGILGERLRPVRVIMKRRSWTAHWIPSKRN